MMKRAWKRTKFPRFRSKKSQAPDLEELDSDSSISSTESLRNSCGEGRLLALEENFKTKEDEDVAVFLKLASNMPISSLLFLLQNTVKQLNFPQSYSLDHSRHKAKPLPKVKKFRFAEINGGAVRQVVHIIPRNDEDCEESLWWTQEEMKEIRAEASYVVSSFRRSKESLQSLSDSIEYLANSYKFENSPHRERIALVEKHMKNLTSNTKALPLVRGLEIHIAPIVDESRETYIEAVIDEQDLCLCLNFEESAERIRKAARSASVKSRCLARAIGVCDQIMALAASMSSWDNESNEAVAFE